MSRTFLLVFLLAGTSNAQMRWTPLTLPGAPSARGAPVMAYDPVNREVVLFGGFFGTSYLADTWVLRGHSWTQLSPPVSPPNRAAAGFAWDAPTQRLVLFGGFGATCL